ncbi:MAG: hypothetical protein R3B09_28190 [Nannocystaceae bacterium]
MILDQPLRDRERICGYLDAASVVRWQPGYSYCRFDDGPPDEAMGSRERSDGVWIWPEGLSVYVRRYNVRLPDEFVELMRRRRFTPPAVDLQWADVEVSADRWLRWAAHLRGPGDGAS